MYVKSIDEKKNCVFVFLTKWNFRFDKYKKT